MEAWAVAEIAGPAWAMTAATTGAETAWAVIAAAARAETTWAMTKGDGHCKWAGVGMLEKRNRS